MALAGSLALGFRSGGSGTRYMSMYQESKHWKMGSQGLVIVRTNDLYQNFEIKACQSFVPKISYLNCKACQRQSNGNEGQKKVWMQNLDSQIELIMRGSRHVAKVVLSLVILFGLGIYGAPAFLSSSFGLRAVVGLANRLIPGHAEVHVVKVGWKRPICIEGVSLKGTDGEDVLSVGRVETQASLWSIVRGKAGLGNCTISSLRVNLEQEPKSGLLKILLALGLASRLVRTQRHAKVPLLHQIRAPPSADMSLDATVKARSGDLKIVDGKLTVEDIVAAAFGSRAFVDVLLGDLAHDEEDGLKPADKGTIPLRANMWSEGTQAEAVGFMNLKNQKLNLIRPIKLEMDLSPAVAQLFLARINPVLGEFVGPVVQDEDMPDMVVAVFPDHMVLPSETFKVDVEPMKAVLARGRLAGGIFSLLSKGKEDIAHGENRVNVRTSRIVADVIMDGKLKCSRIDFLIAGKIAAATWGNMDWIDETIEMTLAIPSLTLANVFSLHALPSDYYLKIPVGGTIAHPCVDWKAAAISIAQLSLRQSGSSFLGDMLAFFNGDESVPEPIESIPWLKKS